MTLSPPMHPGAFVFWAWGSSRVSVCPTGHSGAEWGPQVGSAASQMDRSSPQDLIQSDCPQTATCKHQHTRLQQNITQRSLKKRRLLPGKCGISSSFWQRGRWGGVGGGVDKTTKALKQCFTAASLTSETLLIEVRKRSSLPVAAKGAREIKE